MPPRICPPRVEPRRRDRPERRVTETQRQALSALACLQLLRGRAPTLGELAEVLQVSKPAAFYRLHWLEKKGLWQRSGRAITQAGLLSALGLVDTAPPR
jgi:DNA-binding MarR family transcriptional regulator